MSAAENIRIVNPRSLSDLATLTRRWPNTPIIAGGTRLIAQWEKNPDSRPLRVFNLCSVHELQRVQRNDRNLELGSALSFSDLHEIGENLVPPALLIAADSQIPLGIRSLATIGGNIAQEHSPYLGMLPMWEVLDARIEVRRGNNARWLSCGEFRQQMAIAGPDLISRIRYPMFRWNHVVWASRKTAEGSPHCIAAGALIEDGRVAECRIIIGFPGGHTHALNLFSEELSEASVSYSRSNAERIIASFMETVMARRSDSDAPSLYEESAPLLLWYLGQLQQERWTWRFGSDDLARVIRRR